jgi:hypothetical protein
MALSVCLLGCSKRDIRKGGLVWGGCKLDNVPLETLQHQPLKATNITNIIFFATLDFMPLLRRLHLQFPPWKIQNPRLHGATLLICPSVHDQGFCSFHLLNTEWNGKSAVIFRLG